MLGEQLPEEHEGIPHWLVLALPTHSHPLYNPLVLSKVGAEEKMHTNDYRASLRRRWHSI